MGKAASYIAFLRAVNVGGRVVKMERLRALFEELGLTEVRSFIQSGNVFFRTTKRDRVALERSIARHLGEALGYEVPVMLRTHEEVEAALALDPFAGMAAGEDARTCILFVSAPLPESVTFPLEMPKQRATFVAATRGEVFVHFLVGEGRVPNPAAYLEKAYALKATARFFATTRRILEAAKAG